MADRRNLAVGSLPPGVENRAVRRPNLEGGGHDGGPELNTAQKHEEALHAGNRPQVLNLQPTDHVVHVGIPLPVEAWGLENGLKPGLLGPFDKDEVTRVV